MIDIAIHDLDDTVVDELTQQAEANRRSLEDELREILYGAAQARRRELEFLDQLDRIAAMPPDMPPDMTVDMTVDMPQADGAPLIHEDRDG